MERLKVKMGIYRHFKGNDYELFDIATHANTGEKLAIYCTINREKVEDNGIVYARPIEEFLGDVDKEKYPDVKQKERFKYIGPSNQGF